MVSFFLSLNYRACKYHITFVSTTLTGDESGKSSWVFDVEGVSDARSHHTLGEAIDVRSRFYFKLSFDAIANKCFVLTIHYNLTFFFLFWLYTWKKMILPAVVDIALNLAHECGQKSIKVDQSFDNGIVCRVSLFHQRLELTFQKQNYKQIKPSQPFWYNLFSLNSKKEISRWKCDLKKKNKYKPKYRIKWVGHQFQSCPSVLVAPFVR